MYFVSKEQQRLNDYHQLFGAGFFLVFLLFYIRNRYKLDDKNTIHSSVTHNIISVCTFCYCKKKKYNEFQANSKYRLTFQWIHKNHVKRIKPTLKHHQVSLGCDKFQHKKTSSSLFSRFFFSMCFSPPETSNTFSEHSVCCCFVSSLLFTNLFFLLYFFFSLLFFLWF